MASLCCVQSPLQVCALIGHRGLHCFARKNLTEQLVPRYWFAVWQLYLSCAVCAMSPARASRHSGPSQALNQMLRGGAKGGAKATERKRGERHESLLLDGLEKLLQTFVSEQGESSPARHPPEKRARAQETRARPCHPKPDRRRRLSSQAPGQRLCGQMWLIKGGAKQRRSPHANKSGKRQQAQLCSGKMCKHGCCT